MKSITLIISMVLLSLTGLNGCTQNKADAEQVDVETDYSILVFSKTAGWRHESIESGIEAIKKLGKENNFAVTATEDAELFTSENLQAFDAVVFLNTTETIFNDEQRKTFESYIQNGGGFVGVHSAVDTEYDWQWYGELAGAYFDSHPNNPNVRSAAINVEDTTHPATKHLDSIWQKEDEWYNFGYRNEAVNILLTLNTDSYEGSTHPGNHPIAWYHEYDGGRAFYTGLGHTKESFNDTVFLEHLLGGIKYAAGVTN